MKSDKEAKKKGETAWLAGNSPFVVLHNQIIPQNGRISRVYEIKHGAKPPSLDNTYVTRRAPIHALFGHSAEDYEEFKARRRRGRFWNRAKTGERILRARQKHGWSFKMLTLTSSYQSGDLSKDWDTLRRRLERFWHVQNFPFIKVVEYNKKEDLLHLHIIMYTPFIYVEKIRKMWKQIHHAHQVFIEKVKDVGDELDKQFGYLGKYLTKQMARRFSYSRSWVGGIVGISELWKGAVRYYFKLGMNDFSWLIQAWGEFIEGVLVGEIPKRFDSLFDFFVISTW